MATDIDGTIDGTSRSGEVQVTAPPAADWRLASTSGSLDLSLPVGAGFAVDVRTRTGEVFSEFGLLSDEETATHLAGRTTNAPLARLTLTTVSGDLRMHVRAPMR